MEEDLQIIIEGCKNNDRKYQHKLYNLYYKPMHRWILSDFKDVQITEDIVNDAFLRVFKGIKLYEYKGNFEGWLRTIARRAMYDKIKTNKKYMDRTVYPEKIPICKSESQTEKIDYKIILNKIEKLPKQNSTIFNLHLFGYSHTEISKIMNITVGTSKWYLSKSREILKNEIIKNKQN